MPLPEHIDVEAALIYFHAYMYGPLHGRRRLFDRQGLKPRMMVMAEDWEVFAAILLRQQGTTRHSGPDLGAFEVKSARKRGSFEYQYHKDSWDRKLREDEAVGHIFISHWDDLEPVIVRACDGSDLADFFAKWRADKPYSNGEQRFRRSVPYGWVEKNAIILLKIEKGEAAYVWSPESEDGEK